MSYNIEKAVEYAHLWANRRNSAYANFDNMGGDCTNFISQCLFAGGGIMNYTPDVGWFYNSLNSRSAAWSGVPYLYNFLTRNKKSGPYGQQKPIFEAQRGDIVQLSFNGTSFAHSLMVVEVSENPSPENILIATHTLDADYRPISTYTYQIHRLIHIDGFRG